MVQKESKSSVFVIGASIPITPFDIHLICDTDGIVAFVGNRDTDASPNRSRTADVPMWDDFEHTEDGKYSLNECVAFFPKKYLHRVRPGAKAAAHQMHFDWVAIRRDSSAKASSFHEVTLPCAEEGRLGVRVATLETGHDGPWRNGHFGYRRLARWTGQLSASISIHSLWEPLIPLRKPQLRTSAVKSMRDARAGGRTYKLSVSKKASFLPLL